MRAPRKHKCPDCAARAIQQKAFDAWNAIGQTTEETRAHCLQEPSYCEVKLVNGAEKVIVHDAYGPLATFRKEGEKLHLETNHRLAKRLADLKAAQGKLTADLHKVLTELRPHLESVANENREVWLHSTFGMSRGRTIVVQLSKRSIVWNLILNSGKASDVKSAGLYMAHEVLETFRAYAANLYEFYETLDAAAE